VLAFESDAHWEAWLEEHHASSDGVWVKIAKKASGIPTVAYPEVLDTALCFGWIDGQRKALDERYFLQRFTPRRARSNGRRSTATRSPRWLGRDGCGRPGWPRSSARRPTGAGTRPTADRPR
jgi:uncharacterized protein YdeI (YjbR/CyaY-like superfamily)